ncbi:MAG TPA: ankyrin repeat domain-containing protein [Chlamydiales bacterium]|nr:ankyrin repeat domain-containing protein [Chlamydiales bacterium]
MKSKFLTFIAILPTLAINAQQGWYYSVATDKASEMICEDITGLNLSEQYKAGILQQKIVFKEIDPHTLIHKAILENSPEVIRFLLAQGISVDYPDENGMSPLTIAILNRCNYAIDVLLDHRANVNPKIKWNNMTLAEIACRMKDWETLKKLLEKGATNEILPPGETVLRKAILSGMIEMAKNLIIQGIEITPLDVCAAIDSCELSLVELMINRGVDLNSNEHCTPPIILATERQNNAMIKLLAQKGADINKSGWHVSYQEVTSLIVAITRGNLNIVKLLVELGADVNKKSVYRLTGASISPIQLALTRSYPEIVQYLLQHGATA